MTFISKQIKRRKKQYATHLFIYPNHDGIFIDMTTKNDKNLPERIPIKLKRKTRDEQKTEEITIIIALCEICSSAPFAVCMYVPGSLYIQYSNGDIVRCDDDEHWWTRICTRERWKITKKSQ